MSIRLDVQPGVVLRRVAEGDRESLRRIHALPGVARWWDEPAEDFLDDEPGDTKLAIVVDDAVAGLVQFYEENTPKYRHAAIDIYLDPVLHGRGIGTAVVRRVVQHLFDDRGHHRITIDPAADNAVAIRSYEKVGFKRVGLMREYERDHGGAGWHDGLLMEILRSERDGGSVRP